MTQTDMPERSPIPVFISKHQPGLRNISGYGALILWAKGDKAILISRTHNKTLDVTILDPELKWHDDAPMINSAKGPGRWVIECLCEDTGLPSALSAAQLTLPSSEEK